MLCLSSLVLRFRLPSNKKGVKNASLGFFTCPWIWPPTLDSLTVTDETHVTRTIMREDFISILKLASQLSILRLPGNWVLSDDLALFSASYRYPEKLRVLSGSHSCIRATSIATAGVLERNRIDLSVDALDLEECSLSFDWPNGVSMPYVHALRLTNPSFVVNRKALERLELCFPSIERFCVEVATEVRGLIRLTTHIRLTVTNHHT
jgi:hypothetical protein